MKKLITLDTSLVFAVPVLIKEYRIFSIKRPRRLFQTWLGEPGI